MSLEMYSFSSDDAFNYDPKRPVFDSIEFSDDKRQCIIRSGYEIESRYLEAFANDTLTSSFGWMVHATSRDSEYIFHMARITNGGEIFYTRSGSTNQHVYILTGISGQILDVQYHIIGNEENIEEFDWKHLSDNFGDVLIGEFVPQKFSKYTEICRLGRLNSRQTNRKADTKTTWIPMMCPEFEHNTDPDTYRLDQLNPFWVSFSGRNIYQPDPNLLTLSWAGGGVTLLHFVDGTLKSFKLAICRWLD